MTKPHRLVALLPLILAVSAVAAGTAAAQEVDPFYSSRLRDGERKYAAGDFTGAARDLELACFGLLDDPPLLASCLVRLGLAQAGPGELEGFRETFRRLAEVEDRFGGYTRAVLPPDIRSAFEERLLARLDVADLASVAAFAPLARRKEAAALARLPVDQQRRRLAERIAAQPDDPAWRQALAELELSEGQPEAALAALQPVLAAGTTDPALRCLAGLAQAATGSCAEALTGLPSCGGERSGVAEARLGCLVEVGRLAEARRLLAVLRPELRRTREMQRLARELEAGGKGAEPAPPPPGAAEPAAPEATAETGTEAEETVGPLEPEEEARLQKARELLSQAQVASELTEPLRLASAVADAHPEHREAQHLVAEIAYRASRWETAATYFRRGGDPGLERPTLLFYMAVTFYEVGERQAAAEALRRCLPQLERTPFVERYAERILAGGDTPL